MQGRTARGVKGIGLQDDDAVVGAILVRREASVLTMGQNGTGKRTALTEFPLQKRGGLGTLATPSGGSKDSALVAALEVVSGEEISVVTAGGTVERLEADAVPEQGRRTKGNRLVSVRAGDRVVEVARSIGTERTTVLESEGPPESEGGSDPEGQPESAGESDPERASESEPEGQSDLFASD